MQRRRADTWSGDWQARLADRLLDSGYRSGRDFARANPLLSLRQLADSLGQDIAPVQLAATLLREAREQGTLRETARDLLSRALAKDLPNGWDVGEEALSRRAAALGGWISMIEMHGGEDLQIRLFAVADALKELVTTGWTPTGPDDPILIAAFDKGWPSP